jgi:hypothetical protein
LVEDGGGFRTREGRRMGERVVVWEGLGGRAAAVNARRRWRYGSVGGEGPVVEGNGGCSGRRSRDGGDERGVGVIGLGREEQ